VHADPLSELLQICGGLPPVKVNGIKVVGNPHGIRSGWFTHPLNFDPRWLEECSGFEPKEKTDVN